MEENFRKVNCVGINDAIEVNSNGNTVRVNGKTVHQSLVKSKNHKFGFYQVSVNGKRLYVHRLVAEAFVKNPKPVSYKLVLHKNGNTTDNEHSNLEWGDKKKSLQHRKKRDDKSFRGHSTISYEEALSIAERLDNGEFAKDISKEYGVSEMSIARIRKRYCQQKNKSVRYSREIKENILRLCQKHSPSHVANITKIPYHTIWRWLKLSGENQQKSTTLL